MPLDFCLCLLLFPLVTFGLAWPLAGRLALDPAEKLCATAVLSLLGAYLLAFAIYLLGLPATAFWALPVLASAGLVAGRRTLRGTLADLDVRGMLMGLVLGALWCVGWLTLVVSYSGGGWASDWYEHWERTRFFLERWPVGTKFLGVYQLPARPPLANLVTGALLGPTGATFAGYQLVTTLLNCLAFLPAALLARRFHSRQSSDEPVGGGRAAIAVLTVLLMLNPSFMENATFAWTKLIAAFFTLSGVYFFLRAHDSVAPPAAAPLCAASLAAGILAHYSAGPYVVLLAVAWFGLGRTRWREPAFWRRTALAGLVGAAILATWFGWSFVEYGLSPTLASNSSAAVQPAWRDHQLLKIGLNLRDTLVPHFLRTVDPALIAQRSPWGYLRDWLFQLYQVNLLFVFGSVAWLALLVRLTRDGRTALPRQRGFWGLLAGGAILLGVGVHGARDTWGLAHICLQTLVVLGLAYLAARWPVLGRGWRITLLAGAALDLILGIALQFAVQNYALDRWLAPHEPPLDLLQSYSEPALMNLGGKLVHHVEFLSDVLPVPGVVVSGFLACILALALGRAARAARPEALAVKIASPTPPSSP